SSFSNALSSFPCFSIVLTIKVYTLSFLLSRRILYSSFLHLSHQFCQIMPRPDEQSHDRQIIQEKEDQRLFKIEEDKGILQRHVSLKAPADDGIGSRDRNADSEDPQDDPARPGRFFAESACHSHHHVPVEAQMQG